MMVESQAPSPTAPTIPDVLPVVPLLGGVVAFPLVGQLSC
jgi:hypothetical protein